MDYELRTFLYLCGQNEKNSNKTDQKEFSYRVRSRGIIPRAGATLFPGNSWFEE